MVRYNKVIELLEQGKPVFCSGTGLERCPGGSGIRV